MCRGGMDIRGIGYSSNSGDRLFTSEICEIEKLCGEIDYWYDTVMTSRLKKGSEFRGNWMGIYLFGNNKNL